MKIEIVATKHAPAAIGPYSQAVMAGGLVFCSGQIPLDPGTGEMKGTTVAEQTQRALQNLAAVLDAAGSGLGQVVKTTVFLKNMAAFAEMNAVYEEAFGEHRPARAAVEVSELPRGALVEIEAVALAR
ncbi:MAG: RidA family protein [Acidobacteriota bacterium]|nr:RidA family protein [Acidobacteriota bacterium]